MKVRLAAPLILFAALAAMPLIASDFTFHVPVTIINVPSATQIKVTCSVSKIDVGGVLQFAGGNVVGSGSAFRPVAGGAFAGTVTVEANAAGIISPSAARSYSCSLDLYGRATTGVSYDGSPGNMADVVSTAAGQTLIETKTVVSGSIPGH
jgi:hypothetical protein